MKVEIRYNPRQIEANEIRALVPKNLKCLNDEDDVENDYNTREFEIPDNPASGMIAVQLMQMAFTTNGIRSIDFSDWS